MQVLFVGGGSQARLCHHLLVAQGHSVPCVFDSKGIVPPWPCQVSKNESELSKLARMCDAFLVCIGDAYGSQRTKYSELLLDVGLFPADAISPACFIGDTVKTGRGLQAMPHSVVNQFSRIGDWCILNTNCTVDHECEIGKGVHVMGSAAIAGRVKVGDHSTIGTNATILPDLTIGHHCYIGAGAVVTKDVSDNSVMVGVPAKRIRSQSPV